MYFSTIEIIIIIMMTKLLRRDYLFRSTTVLGRIMKNNRGTKLLYHASRGYFNFFFYPDISISTI